jgi:hypothetical protein
MQRLLDQHSSETGAVDEEVAFGNLARFERQRPDEARALVLVHRADLALEQPEMVKVA